MPAWMLITLFLIFFLVSFRILLKRDDLLAVYYACLFIYTFFTQLGYGVYPGVAMKVGFYFGPDVFYDYWWFISLSFVVIFGLLLVLVNVQDSRQPAFSTVARPDFMRDFILFGAGGAFTIYMIYYVFTNQESLTYVSVTSSEGGQIFAFASAILNILLLTYYSKFRWHANSRGTTALAFVYFMISLAFLILRAILSGDRTIIVSQFMALTAFELMPFELVWEKMPKKLVVIGILGIVSALAMQRINLTRGFGDFSLALFFDPSIKSNASTGAMESIIRQDYFAPSLSLIASMYTEYIDPGEVLRSNFNNTLILQNYPYLSETVGRLLVRTTRKQGPAYYILIEGYNFAGWWGILYNGVVIVSLLAIWRRIKSSNNEGFNRFMTAIMISLMIPMVRGQSCYFLKNIYMILLPAIFLYYLVSGWFPFLRKRSNVALNNQTR